METETDTQSAKRQRKSHIWELEEHSHYVESEWCSSRLFDEEPFTGTIYDPACGFGRILDAARAHGFKTRGSDIVNRERSQDHPFIMADFLTASVGPEDNIVSNPPFSEGRAFAEKALKVARRKVAMIFPIRRLNAMWNWISATPLYRIWLLTPRPSMPPGKYITDGGKVGGGTLDFAWLVFLHGYDGSPLVEWLHRDGNIKELTAPPLGSRSQSAG